MRISAHAANADGAHILQKIHLIILSVTPLLGGRNFVQNVGKDYTLSVLHAMVQAKQSRPIHIVVAVADDYQIINAIAVMGKATLAKPIIIATH